MKCLVFPFFLITILLLLISGKRAEAQATPPTWWNWTVDGTEDSSAAAQGQAKYLFDLALQYLDTELYEVGGAGVAINDMIGEPWFIDTTHDLKAVQLGQLKTLAAPFYQRLSQVGFDTTTINPADPTGIYPWTDIATDDQDDALANIGQLKYVYQFELPAGFVPVLVPGTDADGDGFDDYIEWNTYVKFDENDAYDSILTIFPYDDFDGDNLTNYEEESLALDGTSIDSDSDFFEDGVGIEGFIVREYWRGISSGLLSDLKSFDNTTEKYPGQPLDFHYVDATETPANWVDNEGAALTHYGARMRGLIAPPVTGTYELTLTADNGVEADLWVSRDAALFNRYPRLPLVAGESQNVTLNFEEGYRYYFEINYVATTQDSPVNLSWRITSTAGTNPIPTSETIASQYLSNPNYLPNSHWAFEEGIGNSISNQATDPSAQSAHYYSSIDVLGPTDDSKWIEGVLGKAILFEGPTDHVQLDSLDDPVLSADFTISTWVRIDESFSANRYMRLFSQKEDFWNIIPGYEIEYNPYQKRLTFCGNRREQFIAYDVDLSYDWNHVAVNFALIPNTSPPLYTPTLYVNGQRLVQYAVSAPFSPLTQRLEVVDGFPNTKDDPVMIAAPERTTPLTFGAHSIVPGYNNGQHLIGALDEMKIFDRALGDDVAFEFLKIAAIEEEKPNPENWESPVAWVNEAPEAFFRFPIEEIYLDGLSNFDFETGDLSDWTFTGNVVVESIDSFLGIHAAKLSGNSAELTQVVFELEPNSTYTVSVWSKGEAFELGVRNHGGPEEFIVVDGQADYEQASLVFTTDSQTTSAEVFCRKVEGSSDTQIDNFSVVLGIDAPLAGHKLPAYLYIGQEVDFILGVSDFENAYIRAELFEVNSDGDDISLGVIDPLDPTVHPLTGVAAPGPGIVDPDYVAYEVSVFEDEETPEGSEGKSYYITAEDFNGASVTSDTVTVVWLNAPPEVDWVFPINHARFETNTNIDLIARVTDIGGQIATVKLREVGGPDIATGSYSGNDEYTFSVNFSNPGVYDLEVYATDTLDATGISSSLNIVIEPPFPTAIWQEPFTEANFEPGTSIALKVLAFAEGSTIDNVKFYDEDDSLIGQDSIGDPQTSGMYEITTNFSTQGRKSLYATVSISNPSMTLKTDRLALNIRDTSLMTPPTLIPDNSSLETPASFRTGPPELVQIEITDPAERSASETAFRNIFNDQTLTFTNGWLEAGNNFWMGEFFVWAYPWVYHEQHGWLWMNQTSTSEDYWFYSIEEGWLLTNSSEYAWIWFDDIQEWRWYLEESKAPRWFYSPTDARWFSDQTTTEATPPTDIPTNNISSTSGSTPFPDSIEPFADSDGDSIANLHEHLIGGDPQYIGDDSTNPDVILSSLAESVQVSESGAFVASIPLAVTPGISGMTPEVGVSYSSQGGNGLLGVGFSLSGLSSITRGPLTKAVDGVHGTVNFDDDDRYYFDGKRLIAVNGNDGQDGTEYRTEIESFSVITSFDDSPETHGPERFVVKTKSGLIMEYGYREEARLLPTDRKGVLAWYLTKVTDISGNYYEWFYHNDSNDGILLPKRIAYTGNENQGLEPNNFIEYVYEERPDVSTGYRLGVYSKNLYRVKEIRSYHGSERFRTYSFKYEQSEVTNRSLLQGVVTHNSDGSTALLPTTFEWHDEHQEKTFSKDWGDGKVTEKDDYTADWFYGDFDNDGKTDTATVYEQFNGAIASGKFSIDVYFSDGDKLTDVQMIREASYYQQNHGGGYPQGHFVQGDFDGDGNIDFCQVTKKNGSGNASLIVVQNSGIRAAQSWTHSIWLDTTTSYDYNEPWIAGDFNRDGLTDILHIDRSGPNQHAGSLQLDLYTSDGTTFTKNDNVLNNPSQAVFFYDGYINQEFRVGDFNGDGFLDLFQARHDSGYKSVELFVNQKDGTFVHSKHDYLPMMRSGSHHPGPFYWLPGDMNADGNMDMVLIRYRDVFVYYYENERFRREKLDIEIDLPGYSSSKYTFPKTGYRWTTYQTLLDNRNNYTFRLGDYFNDGYIDLVASFRGARSTRTQSKIRRTTTSPAKVTLYNFKQPSASENYIIETVNLSSDITGQSSTISFWNAAHPIADDIRLYSEIFSADFTGNGVFDLMWLKSRRTGDLGNNTYIRDVDFYGLTSDELSTNLVTGIRGGLGTETKVTYKPMTNIHGTVYEKGDGHAALLPGTDRKYDVIAPSNLVAEVKKDSGLDTSPGNTRYTTHTYRYEKLVSSVDRGSLGFRTIKVTDDYDGALETITTTNYRQDYPYTGMVELTRTTLGDGTTKISETEVTEFGDLGAITGFLKDPKLRYPVAERKEERTYELNNSNTPYSKTTHTMLADTTHYDSWGNVLKMKVALGDSANSDQFVTTTTNIYSHPSDPDYPRYGRLTQASVEKTSPTAPTQTRISQFTYYEAGETGGFEHLLKSEIVEPGTSNELTTSYIYDRFGNIVGTSVTGVNITSRSSYTVFDSNGRFPIAEINALGHPTRTTYDDVSGTVLTVTGPNNLTTSNTYDSFDRLIEVQSPDGSRAYTKRLLPSDSGDSNLPAQTVTSVKTWTDAATGAYSLVHYDRLGRELRTVGINGNGQKVYKDTVYNVRGLVDQISQPYFAGTSPSDWSYSYFDDLGRVVLQVNPGEGCVGFSYDGITTEQFRVLSVKPGETLPDLTQYLNDIGGQFNGLRNSWGAEYIERVVSTKDLAGQLVSIEDNEGRILQHQYDVYGNLLTTTLPSGGGTISMSYDIRGNKTSMTDPNMGTWYYCYNVLGELMEQYDAVGNAIVFEYDILGRMTKREDFEGVTVTSGNGTASDYLTGTSSGHTTWHYDRITEELTVPNDPDGNQYSDNKAIGKLILTQTSGGYKNALHYDGLGRLKINREKNSGQWYDFETTYDTFSRPLTLKYPDGDLIIKNAYDSTYGDLESVFNETTPSTVYWEAGSSVAQYDSLGHLTQFKYGNGLYTRTDFDQATGFLNSIETGVNTSDSSIQNLTYNFTKVGFLSKREDHNKNLREAFTYDSLNRLEEVKLTQDVGGNESTSTANITYNALGNILTKPGVTGTYTYGGASGGPNAVTATGSHTYLYNTNGSLLKRTLTSDTSKTQDYTWNAFNKVTTIENESNDVSTFYYGSDRQRIVQYLDRTIGDDKTTYYINGGLYEKIENNDGTSTTFEERHYINAPSGRVAVFVEKTGEADKTEYFHYDHQGSIDKITSDAGSIVAEYSYDAWGAQRDAQDWSIILTTQSHSYSVSYTGHENLDEFGIVHMNGRLYDASLGRFISTDPHIQAPGNLQNYNRYSYVLNNPMSYTDPSGYFLSGLFKKIGKFFKKYWRAIVAIAAAATLQFWALPAIGIKGLGAAIISGAVAGGITDGVRGAITGGITAGLLYGIGDAFVGKSVGFSRAGFGNLLTKSVAHGIVGGTSAVINGGKFKHGFFSGFSTQLVGSQLRIKTDGLDEIAYNTAISAVVGGTAAEIGGGQFENGAVTGAFGYLFNDGLHEAKQKIIQQKIAYVTIKLKPSLLKSGTEIGEAVYETGKEPIKDRIIGKTVEKTVGDVPLGPTDLLPPALQIALEAGDIFVQGMHNFEAANRAIHEGLVVYVPLTKDAVNALSLNFGSAAPSAPHGWRIVSTRIRRATGYPYYAERRYPDNWQAVVGNTQSLSGQKISNFIDTNRIVWTKVTSYSRRITLEQK